MGDKTRGLYGKFYVARVDESDMPGGKHQGCDYFVLDLSHDPYAGPAIQAYIDACKDEYPLLAEDLRKKHLGEKRPAQGVATDAEPEDA